MSKRDTAEPMAVDEKGACDLPEIVDEKSFKEFVMKALPKVDLSAYQGAHDAVKDVPSLVKETLEKYESTYLREMLEHLKAVRFTVEENKKRIDWLGEFAAGPRDWVLQQAPATWYTSVREVYMKALQWETNNSHRVESHKAESVKPAKVFAHVRGDSRNKRDFQDKREPKGRGSFPKRKSSFTGGRQKRPRTEGEKKKEYKIPSALYDQRIAEDKCWKCGLEGHRATACKNRLHGRARQENPVTFAWQRGLLGSC